MNSARVGYYLLIFFQGMHYIFMVYGVFQVGHRDLEDILKDIDLNGDGRVDFEGKNCDFYEIFASDFQF